MGATLGVEVSVNFMSRGLCGMDGWMDGWINRWMDGWMGGWIGGKASQNELQRELERERMEVERLEREVGWVDGFTFFFFR